MRLKRPDASLSQPRLAAVWLRQSKWYPIITSLGSLAQFLAYIGRSSHTTRRSCRQACRWRVDPCHARTPTLDRGI